MKIWILFVLFFFIFGCIEQPRVMDGGLELSENEISIEEGKMKLLEAENVGIIIDARGITQKNYEAVANCAIGYSFSLAAKGKNIYNYAIDENDCWNNESKKTTYEECSKHIKENVEYNIYLVGGEEADAIFYEDNMRVVVPEDNIIECTIR